MVETRLAEPRFRTGTTPPPAGATAFGVHEVYFTLFRHKWKILACAALGGLAAGLTAWFWKSDHVSSTKLFVRYVVVEGKSTPSDTTITKSPDSRGETIIQSEQEILSSLDLATKVAQAVGPERILKRLGGADSLPEAAVAVQERTKIFVPRSSSVITVTFNHPDAEVAQAVTRQIVDTYLKTHVEIHRSAGMVGQFLAQETDQLRSRLAQTEEELRRARAKAGVHSIDEARRAYGEQINILRSQILAARAEQAAKASVLKELSEKQAQRTPANSGGQPAEPAAATPAEAEPTNADLENYRFVVGGLEQARRREQELLLAFTAENPRVKATQAQLAELERRRQELEAKFPQLTRTVARGRTDVVTAAEVPPDRSTALEMESVQLNALEARIKTLGAQMESLRAEAASLDQVEGSIQELLRKRELEESNYRRYAASLEQSRINEALGSGKVSNISVIQAPTPGLPDHGKRPKIIPAIAVGGLALGIAWAFLVELVVDRTVRRPAELERNPRAPLFLSIPRQSPPKPRGSRRRQPPSTLVGQSTQALVPAESAHDPLDAALAPYCETLRDRLIGYFESVNLTHKPKLIGLTGLSVGAGVTTTAAGLARTLSETGDGNVLLVDLTPGQGSARHFHQGKAGYGIEDLLATRDDSAQVQDRLYVVSEDNRGDKLSRMLPQRFAKLVPQLKSGDFDYIIFDMPPVSQISITPRLAGYMDMVLMVVEAEKNTREALDQANELLLRSNARIGTVLNKTKSYVPTWVTQELPA